MEEFDTVDEFLNYQAADLIDRVGKFNKAMTLNGVPRSSRRQILRSIVRTSPDIVEREQETEVDVYEIG